MAEPGRPERCRQIVAAVDASRAIMLYDFPELFDPLTARILDYLAGFRDLRLAGVLRPAVEGPRGPGQPAQLQADGPHPVPGDGPLPGLRPLRPGGGAGGRGRCPGRRRPRGRASPTPTRRRTRRPIPTPSTAGAGTGRRFGGVRGRGADRLQAAMPRGPSGASSGASATAPRSRSTSPTSKAGSTSASTASISRATRRPTPTSTSSPRRSAGPGEVDRDRLMDGLYPNPRFTQVTYQLSGALWRSCRDREEVGLRVGRATQLVGCGLRP